MATREQITTQLITEITTKLNAGIGGSAISNLVTRAVAATLDNLRGSVDLDGHIQDQINQWRNRADIAAEVDAVATAALQGVVQLIESQIEQQLYDRITNEQV